MILNSFIFKFKKLKIIFSKILNKILFLFGYDINFRKISEFEIHLIKLNKLKKQNAITDYKDQKKYLDKIKNFNGPQMFKKWEEIIIEWENCNPEVFKKLEEFYQIREKNLENLGLSKFKIDFISKNIFTGSFGIPFIFKFIVSQKI